MAKMGWSHQMTEGGFTFDHMGDRSIRVTHRREVIGHLETWIEPSGRHCFAIEFDDEDPMTFRGRVVAAKALLKLHKLVKFASKQAMLPEQLILEAWKNPPTQSR